MVVTEDSTRNKKGKRVHLNYTETKDLINKLNEFESKIEIPRIKIGERQLSRR